MYDIIHCSFFEKADKEGHLVVTLPPHYHHMATTGAGGSLYARTLSQHLVAVFLRLSRQRGNTSLFERRVAGHLRFRGRGRGGKGRGANGCRRRLSAATTQVDEPGLRKIGALRSPHPGQADLPHAHPGVELRRWSPCCIDEECQKGDTCKIEAALDQCLENKGKEAARQTATARQGLTGASAWSPCTSWTPNALEKLRREAVLVPGSRRCSERLGIAACNGGALDMATQLTGHLLELLLLSRRIIVCQNTVATFGSSIFEAVEPFKRRARR